MDTITLPTEVVESLIALSGTGMYGTPTQRYHLSDAQDALARQRLAVSVDPNAGGAEQMTLFDPAPYEVQA